MFSSFSPDSLFFDMSKSILFSLCDCLRKCSLFHVFDDSLPFVLCCVVGGAHIRCYTRNVHYFFSCFGYIDGLYTLVRVPFLCCSRKCSQYLVLAWWLNRTCWKHCPCRPQTSLHITCSIGETVSLTCQSERGAARWERQEHLHPCTMLVWRYDFKKKKKLILFTTVLSQFDISHGKFGLPSLGKASCDRVALPNLQCMPGTLVLP